MHATTVIVGAGHAGLAMSRRLTERSIDHVVLERGEVANSWRTERWDSLRLLTPNWQTRLPGFRYTGNDPDGFMTMPEVVGVIAGYARRTAAPVRTSTTVTRIRATGTGSGTGTGTGTDAGYEVITDRGVWTCATVVLASGAANIAHVPALAQGAPTSVEMVTPMTYRSPAGLGEHGVLVVGASASGIQIADEIHRSGRPVTIAVGEHVRLPRTYRGRDIFWWMDAAGILDQRFGDVDDLVRARHLPSPQLIGTPERRTIDLNTLVERGVEIVGRLGRIDDGVAQFSGALANVCMLADLKLNRLLDTLDEWARTSGPDLDLDIDDRPRRNEPTRVPPSPSLDIDLRRAGIGTIIWATGYRPDHSWLDVPVFDHKGRIRHDGGVVRDAPGMYLLGANFLRRRRSSFIHGAESDTDELSSHLQRYLDSCCTPPKRRPVPVS